MTEIKLPTCRTVRAERPVCPKVVGAGGGGGGREPKRIGGGREFGGAAWRERG